MGILTGGFASLAARVLSSIYTDAAIVDQTEAAYDAGGSIIVGGAPTNRPCRAQVDVADWRMVQAADYVLGTMRVLILADTLAGTLGTDAVLVVNEGPHVGRWQVSGLSLDAAGSHWTGTGRRA